MSKTEAAGAPGELDPRLERRDTSPLGAEELLRVQAINRGKNPVRNQRFSIMESGAVYEGGHSDDSNDWQTPFDQPLSDEPTRFIRAANVKKLRALLETRFAGEPGYQADETAEGGLFMVVTGRTRDGSHEVIYDATRPAILNDILALAWD